MDQPKRPKRLSAINAEKRMYSSIFNRNNQSNEVSTNDTITTAFSDPILDSQSNSNDVSNTSSSSKGAYIKPLKFGLVK